MLKRVISLLIAIIFMSSAIQVKAEITSKYYTIEKPMEATVTEVLSGQSIMVQLKENSEYAYVKMIGLNSLSYDKAFEYVSESLKGQIVHLVPDSYIKNPLDKWNQMYVYVGNVNFNDLLIKEGYAKYDPAYDSALASGKLKTSDEEARLKILGIYNQYPNTLTSASNSYASIKEPDVLSNTNNSTNNNTGSTTTPSYLNQQININLATASELKFYLKDVSTSLSERIVSYRNSISYFNTVEQIKSVTGFTNTIFESNKDRMVVVTNVTTANSDELKIISFTSDEAQKLIDYRTKNTIRIINLLYDTNIITRTKFNAIRNYISITYQSQVSGSNVDTGIQVNINTANSEQLVKNLVGVDSDLADKIISFRQEKGYFTIVSRIRDVPDFTRMMYDDNKDIMTTRTNINTANKEMLEMLGLTEKEVENIINYRDRYEFKTISELLSGNLVSKEVYDKIMPFVTITTTSNTNDYDRVLQVNINTATPAQLEKYLYGVSADLAYKIDRYRFTDGRKYFMTLADIKNVEGFTEDIYLMNKDIMQVSTNIKTANYDELIILGFTDSEANSFLSYRNSYSIYNVNELRSRNIISQEKYDYLFKVLDTVYISTITSPVVPVTP